jgi:hypothetical protein
MDLEFVKNHIRNRPYMSGVDREKSRVRSTGEVFTPYDLVIKYIDYCESQDPTAFIFPKNNFCDNSCGDGQFLGEILIRKMERGISFEEALEGLYGVDFQISNVILCRERLLCGSTDQKLVSIVEKNIQCRNALKFGYNFEPMGPARRKTEEKLKAKQLRLKTKQEKSAKLEEIKKKKEMQEKKLFGQMLT